MKFSNVDAAWCRNFAKELCQEHVSLFCFAWTPRRDFDEKLLVETRKQHRGSEVSPNLDPEVMAQCLQGFHCSFLILLAFSNMQQYFYPCRYRKCDGHMFYTDHAAPGPQKDTPYATGHGLTSLKPFFLYRLLHIFTQWPLVHLRPKT